MICPAAGGATILPLQTPHGRLQVLSLHLHWPFPYGQRAQVAALSPELAAVPGAVLVGGDFNMVPWGWPLEAIGLATRTVRAGPAWTSFRVKDWLPLSIDHVLAPGSGLVERRPLLGSDHHGLLARLWP